jgi:hypothetical protein
MGPADSYFDEAAESNENHAFRLIRDTRDTMSDVSLQNATTVIKRPRMGGAVL